MEQKENFLSSDAEDVVSKISTSKIESVIRVSFTANHFDTVIFS